MSFTIKIGNYRFSKNLGTGSFGKVKLAVNDVTQHKVAIKILNKKKIKQQGVFEKVKREIKVLRQFNHPHIIKHYEFIDTPSDIFMVIEFASGGELFDLISRRERLTEEEARRFFQQIYSSIEYTHAHKIAHRDLKPENLLLDEYNNIKLIDFGLANSMKDSQALKTACGSPNYAAPEVISGRSYSGVEVDIWSLGVILFAMVCGSLPFDDDSMSQLFNKIKEGKYYMPNYISSDVKDLINRMLQPNPVKRITMKEIKEHPWYLKDLPQYIIDLSHAHSKQAHELDYDIVKKLFTLNINLVGRSEEEIIKAIKEKKNTDFCGIYELLYHDKMKKDCLNIQNTNNSSSHPDDDPLTSAFQSSSPRSTSNQGGSKLKQFRTLKHTLMHCEESCIEDCTPQRVNSNVSNPVAKSDPCNSYTLLSTRHQDRLSRLVKKFRAGEHKMSPMDPQKHAQINTVTSSKVIVHPPSSIISTQVETAATTTLTNNYIKNHSNLQEVSIPKQPRQHQRWVFGIIFKGAPIDLMSLICEVLRLLEIEWQIIPKDLKMKCRSKIDENSVNEYEHSLLLNNQIPQDELASGTGKDEMIKEFLKKNFVKFYINIYKDPSNPSLSNSSQKANSNNSRSSASSNQGSTTINQASGTPLEDDNGVSRYMLDVHLFRGMVYVFMDFVRKFTHVLTASFSMCNSNSCCSSSNHSSNQQQIPPILSSHSHDYKLKIV